MSHGYSGRGLINYFINKKQRTLYIQFNLLILLVFPRGTTPLEISYAWPEIKCSEGGWDRQLGWEVKETATQTLLK